MQKKVVLSGYYGWKNIGDDAILKSIIEWLRENELTPVVICNDHFRIAEELEVETVGREDFGGIVRALKDAEAYISGGGSLIQDVTSKKSALYYLIVLFLANKYMKDKTFVYGQGIGPLNTPWLRKMTKRVFSDVKKITVRDEKSMDFLRKEVGVKNHIELIQDPVLLSELNNDAKLTLNKEELSLLEQEPVFISLKPNEYNSKMKREIKKVIMNLEKQGKKVISIPFHAKQDLEITKEVFSGCENTYIFERELSIDDVLFILKKSKLVLGMRLHSLIMASAMNTPVLAISYDPKIDAFANIIGSPVVCDIGNFDSKKINAAIDNAHSNYEEEKERVVALVKELKKANDKANQDIVRIIKGE